MRWKNAPWTFAFHTASRQKLTSNRAGEIDLCYPPLPRACWHCARWASVSLETENPERPATDSGHCQPFLLPANTRARKPRVAPGRSIAATDHPRRHAEKAETLSSIRIFRGLRPGLVLRETPPTRYTGDWLIPCRCCNPPEHASPRGRNHDQPVRFGHSSLPRHCTTLSRLPASD